MHLLRVFVTGKPLRLSLTFEVRLEPFSTLQVIHSWVGSWAYRKHQTRLQKPFRNKHSAYDEHSRITTVKSFIMFGLALQTCYLITLQYSVISKISLSLLTNHIILLIFAEKDRSLKSEYSAISLSTSMFHRTNVRIA